MVQPPATDIAQFLEIFKRLEVYEGEQRHLRGYGAFKESEIPDQATLRVIAWLKELAKDYPAPPEALR